MNIFIKTLLAVFIFIDLFLAWWYTNDRNICKVVIFCTAAIYNRLCLCE